MLGFALRYPIYKIGERHNLNFANCYLSIVIMICRAIAVLLILSIANF